MSDPTPPRRYELLREALLAGSSVDDAAKLAGIGRRTAFSWVAQHRLELFAAALHGSPALRFIRPMAIGRPRGPR